MLQSKENAGWRARCDQNDCNHVQFNWNFIASRMAASNTGTRSASTHSVAIFKATLMHQESNKTAMRQSVCLQVDLFVINQQKLQTRGCELLYIYMETLIHTFRV